MKIFKYLFLFILIAPFMYQDLGAFQPRERMNQSSGSPHYTSDQQIDRRNYGRENYPSWKANGGINNQNWNGGGGIDGTTNIRILR